MARAQSSGPESEDQVCVSGQEPANRPEPILSLCADASPSREVPELSSFTATRSNPLLGAPARLAPGMERALGARVLRGPFLTSGAEEGGSPHFTGGKVESQ